MMVVSSFSKSCGCCPRSQQFASSTVTYKFPASLVKASRLLRDVVDGRLFFGHSIHCPLSFTGLGARAQPLWSCTLPIITHTHGISLQITTLGTDVRSSSDDRRCALTHSGGLSDWLFRRRVVDGTKLGCHSTDVGRSIIKLSNFAKTGQLTLDTTDYYTLGYHRINNSPKQSRTFLRGGTMATQVMITHSTAAVLIYYFQNFLISNAASLA